VGLETATILGIGALVTSAAGATYAGIQQSNAADYSASVSEQAARAAKDKAQYDENKHREMVRQIISSQNALYGKSGVDMTGSPLLTLEDTAGQGELDALAIRHGGDVEAARQRSAAALAEMKGDSAFTSGLIGAGSSLLTGASKVKW
jgi:hypothetical protein